MLLIKDIFKQALSKKFYYKARAKSLKNKKRITTKGETLTPLSALQVVRTMSAKLIYPIGKSKLKFISKANSSRKFIEKIRKKILKKVHLRMKMKMARLLVTRRLVLLSPQLVHINLKEGNS